MSRANQLAILLTGLVGLGALRVAAAEGPAVRAMRSDTQTVGLYEKFELRIGLRANYANPFDPEEADLRGQGFAP